MCSNAQASEVSKAMARKPSYSQHMNHSSAIPHREPKTSGVPAQIMGPRVLLLLSALALLLLGFVMVYSASSIVALSEGESTESYFIKQVVFALIGVVGCVIIWKFIPLRLWQSPFIWVIWGIGIALLLATVFVGDAAYGAQRWVFGLQPSEFTKIVFVIMAAKLLNEYREGELSFASMVGQAFLVILLPIGIFLLYLQSDLGTTMICLVGVFIVMWLGEIPLRLMLGIALAGVVLVLLASTVGYRQDRMIFMNPWQDELGDGYQLIHSFYAFAEGGLFGVGLGNSREKFLYLPMSETDFIYAIIGEELGLIGAFLVVVLFLVFLFAGMRIARLSPDGFSAMVAGGLTAMVVFQAFLNIGCVVGLLPTTGKPLPFISSGGSSLIASLFMLGVILSTSQASQEPNVYEQRRNDLRVLRAQDPLQGMSSRSYSGSARSGMQQRDSQRMSSSYRNTSSQRGASNRSRSQGRRRR